MKNTVKLVPLAIVVLIFAAGDLRAADVERLDQPVVRTDIDTDIDRDDVDVDVDLDDDADLETRVDTDVNSGDNVRTTVTTVTTTETEVGSAPTDYDMDDLDVEIVVDKSTPENEDVHGSIIIKNNGPRPIPATFYVKLFHDDQLFRHLRVEMDDEKDLIPPGKTTYSLEEFGIPDLNENRNYAGDWVIMIYQDPNRPGESEEAKFHVEHDV